MSAIDIVIFLLVIVGLLVGYIKGLVSQITTLCGIVLGLLACNLLGDMAKQIFVQLVPECTTWPSADVTVNALANIVLFVAVFIVVVLIGRGLRAAVNTLKLGFLDKILGAAFCTLKYVLVLSVALNLWLAVKPNSKIFTTCHAMGNVPFELTLDAAPAVFGMDTLPSSTLKVEKAEPRAVKET